MVANYESHGFRVMADTLPKTCTACPFWLVETETFESGMCFITGQSILANGPHDKKRMDDCPIEKVTI